VAATTAMPTMLVVVIVVITGEGLVARCTRLRERSVFEGHLDIGCARG